MDERTRKTPCVPSQAMAKEMVQQRVHRQTSPQEPNNSDRHSIGVVEEVKIIKVPIQEVQPQGFKTVVPVATPNSLVYNTSQASRPI